MSQPKSQPRTATGRHAAFAAAYGHGCPLHDNTTARHNPRDRTQALFVELHDVAIQGWRWSLTGGVIPQGLTLERIRATVEALEVELTAQGAAK